MIMKRGLRPNDVVADQTSCFWLNAIVEEIEAPPHQVTNLTGFNCFDRLSKLGVESQNDDIMWLD